MYYINKIYKTNDGTVFLTDTGENIFLKENDIIYIRR